MGSPARPSSAGGSTALARGTKIAVAYARQPREALERTIEKVADERARRSGVPRYDWCETWERDLHALLGSPFPCTVAAEFERIWNDITDAFRERGLPFGRGAFGGWDDADPALARATWCVVRHRTPQVVVETGVARGVTTRVILEALARNRRGHLWSIDLPPLLESDLEDQTGVVVPAERRNRWTLVRGSSRRRLRELVTRLGAVDVFVHDSFHSERNLRFEWETVVPHLSPHGVLLADDVQMNAALARFASAHPRFRPLVCSHDDSRGLFAVAGEDRGFDGVH